MNSALRPSVSFIVLALNEEAHIEATVRAVSKAVEGSTLSDHEIVLVNDGSTDKTGEVMEHLAVHNPKIKVVHNPHNLGLGNAYKSGLRVATGDYVMIIAGDDIMPSTDIALILECVGQADVILPYLSNPKLRPLGRRIGSKGFTILINLIFGLRIRYYQAVLPRRALLEKITIVTNSHAFPAEIGVKLLKAGSTYIEVGILDTPSKTGNSVAVQPKRVLAVIKAVIDLVREIRRPGAIPVLEKVRPPVGGGYSP